MPRASCTVFNLTSSLGKVSERHLETNICGCVHTKQNIIYLSLIKPFLRTIFTIRDRPGQTGQTRPGPGPDQDQTRTRTRTRPGPDQDQDQDQTRPDQDQDQTRTRTRTRPGQDQDQDQDRDQDRTRTRTGPDQEGLARPRHAWLALENGDKPSLDGEGPKFGGFPSGNWTLCLCWNPLLIGCPNAGLDWIP